MKIIIYSQNIWGVGHFFRSLEICRALSNHDVILIIGGDRVDIPLPEHVREVRLPGIMTDREYNNLFTTEPGITLQQAQKQRKNRLLALLAEASPDIFVVELYPFGRNAFRVELDPVLERIRQKNLSHCRVVCSLRDILVEKKDPIAYEKRVIGKLNRYFDALLVHSDPSVLKLDETFSRTKDINIPIQYTGYVAQKPPRGARLKIRRQLGIKQNEILIVASAGGGKAGATLMQSVIAAFLRLNTFEVSRLYAFTGPYLSQEEFDTIRRQSGNRVYISRFSTDFLSYLAAADLSVSMAGYNTSMNILATNVPALVWPFSHDREQGLRAERLARLGALTILKNEDLKPSRLSAIMARQLSQSSHDFRKIDLEGATNTARWLEQLTRR
jgi:predicted glycosyltransferase